MKSFLFAFVSSIFATIAFAAPNPGFYENSTGSPLIPLVQSARSSLDIEIYTMQDKKFRSALRSTLKRHVKVRIVKDGSPLGEKCDLFQPNSANTDSDCKDQRKLVEEVRASGGEFVPFNKKALCPNGGGAEGHSCFEHGKIAIADRSTLLLSSGNFDSTNLCNSKSLEARCNRDYTLILDDQDVIDTVEAIFEHDLTGKSYDLKSLIPAKLNGRLTVSPFSLEPLVDFISSAQVSIDIETQYLNEPRTNAALIAAAKRGVRVSVTTASACAFDQPSKFTKEKVTKIYSAFDAAGISSRMFTAENKVKGHPGYLHAKAIVVDGVRAWVGSANGSTTAMTQNREYGYFFDDRGWVEKLLPIMTNDHASPNTESWRESLNCTKDQPENM